MVTYHRHSSDQYIDVATDEWLLRHTNLEVHCCINTAADGLLAEPDSTISLFSQNVTRRDSLHGSLSLLCVYPGLRRSEQCLPDVRQLLLVDDGKATAKNRQSTAPTLGADQSEH